jgi:hypothetical protein
MIEYKLKLIKHLETRCNLWDRDSVSEYVKKSRLTYPQRES